MRLTSRGGEVTAAGRRRRAAIALAQLAEKARRQGRDDVAVAMIGRAYLACDGQLERLTQ